MARFMIDPSYKGPIRYYDLFLLSTSLLKVAEITTLILYDAASLAVFTALPWLYLFICSLFLILFKMLRGYPKSFHRDRVDIITGDLPVFGRPPPDNSRIYLRISQNFRHRWLWRVFWMAGAFIYAFSMVYGYAILNMKDEPVIIWWTCFQLAWFVARFIFFWLARDADDPDTIPSLRKRLKFFTEEVSSTEILHSPEKNAQLSFSDMKRIQMLVLALSRFQAFFHRRGEHIQRRYSKARDIGKIFSRGKRDYN